VHSIAVRTTIIGLLYFSPYFSPYSCNLHLQRQKEKVVCNVLLILLCCSLKIEFRQFSQQMLPQTSRSRLRGRCNLPESLVPMAPSPYHRTWIRYGDCEHVGLLSNIISKKVYWWHFARCRSSFQHRYIDFECKNLVSRFGQEKLWSAWLEASTTSLVVAAAEGGAVPMLSSELQQSTNWIVQWALRQ